VRCFIRGCAGKVVGGDREAVVFGRDATRRNERGPGRDDLRAIGTGERGTECFDRVPIDLANFLESCEVVNETGVDHTVGGGCSAAQALEVANIAPMDVSARGLKRSGSCIRAGEAKHLVACPKQLLNDGGTDEAGGTGDKDAHGISFSGGWHSHHY
jgi:hypothetical protein